MFRSAWTPIGLDVGARWIKAAQARRGRHGLELVRAVRLERAKPTAMPGPSPTAQAAAAAGAGHGVLSTAEAIRVRGVLERHGFHGLSVVMRVPDTKMVKQVMELPPRQSGAPLDQIARGELARACRCGPDQMEASWWELPSGARASEGTHMMGVACAHASAEEVIAGAESAGLRVDALDTLSTAVRRACLRVAPIDALAMVASGTGSSGSSGTLADGLCMIVDLGWHGATIGVFVGDMLAYERCIGDAGLSGAASELSSELGLDDDVARYVIDHLGVDGGSVPSRQATVSSASAAATVHNSPSAIDPGSAATSMADPLAIHANAQLLAEARKIITKHLRSLIDEVRASHAYAGRRFNARDDFDVLVTGGGAGVPGMLTLVRAAAGEHARLVRPTDCLPCPIQHDDADVLREHAEHPALVCALGLALHDCSDAEIGGAA